MLSKRFVNVFFPFLVLLIYIFSFIFVDNIVFYLLFFGIIIFLYKDKLDYSILSIMMVNLICLIIYRVLDSLLFVKIIFSVDCIFYFVNDYFIISKSNVNRVSFNDIKKNLRKFIGKGNYDFNVVYDNLKYKLDYEVKRVNFINVRRNKRLLNLDSLIYLFSYLLIIFVIYGISYAIFSYI